MNDELQVIDSGALDTITRAEFESKIDIAKRYPRDLAKIKKNILIYATADEETAAGCFYSKPVDNKGTLAEGPSIRLAEMIAATYGNIQYGARVIEMSEKWVTVQGAAFDLENNISFTTEIKRSIWSSKANKGKGARYGQNMIETTTKAAAAIAIRDSIYKVVPLGIFRKEMDKIQKFAAGGDTKVSIPERAVKAVEYFTKLGVSETQVFQVVKVTKYEEFTESKLIQLTGLRTAIKDNEITLKEAFNTPQQQAKEEQKEKVQKATEQITNKEGQTDLGV